MATKITSDVLESYLHCKFKGHLTLAGQHGTKCDFEVMLTELRAEVRLKAIDAIIARHPADQVARNIPLTTAGLKQGPQYILDGTLADDALALHFDGLKRAEGASKLGDFHYVPVLFHEGRQVRKEQRLLLEVYGQHLASLQGKAPAYGIVWHGRDCRVSKVRLNTDHRKSEQVLRDLKKMAGAEPPPKLLLNDHCPVCEFQERCHAQAVHEDNLTLLRGLKPKEISRQHRKGIFTVTQYSYTYRPRRSRRKAKKRTSKHQFSLNARAIRTQTTYVDGGLVLPVAGTRLYLDVEGSPDGDMYYLIGLVVCDGTTTSFQQFWADNKAAEGEIWRAFLRTLADLDDWVLFHYGSYESRFVKRMCNSYGINAELQSRLSSRMCNVLSAIHSHVYFPVYSNSLKNVAPHLGFQWSPEITSGLQAAAKRAQWEGGANDSLKKQLMLYNQEDCLALRTVTDVLERIATGSWGSGERAPTPLVNTADLTPGPTRRFRQITFFFPELKTINKCAYFDYQRERVYFRTSRPVRQSLQRRDRSNRASPRVNKEIVYEPPITCPLCRGAHLVERRAVSKVVYSLKKCSGGIKRWVVRHKSHMRKCVECNKSFVPEGYRALGRSCLGWELVGWTVYQNIALLHSQGAVTKELRDVFGLRLSHDIAANCKEQAATHYEPTYRYLIEKLRQGHLAHADETLVSLKGATGYVWAFTSMEEVIYAYSDTREGDMVKEMLKGFKGVLVSDFFAGYDSIAVPQQKCLIHLVRDINDDLFSNPFDEELKRFARLLTELLTPIIATVDRFGLKQYHLHRHKADVEAFLCTFLSLRCESEVVAGYQRRIEKYRGKLFTFLDHDGVPWNNNNAEHAIKRIALLRRVIGGSATVTGLKQYLLLLSISETLNLRSIDSLGFFLSGGTDLEAFSG
jgi:predicted RecB family nuclease